MEMKTMIVLYAPGKCVVKLANREAEYYIYSVGPSIKEGVIEEQIPEDVIYGYEDQFPHGTGGIKISPIQCANERANAVPGIIFGSVVDALSYCRSNDVAISRDIRGVLISEDTFC